MKKWISRYDDHTSKAPRTVWAYIVERGCSVHFQYTPRIYNKRANQRKEIKLEYKSSDDRSLDLLSLNTIHCHSS